MVEVSEKDEGRYFFNKQGNKGKFLTVIGNVVLFRLNDITWNNSISEFKKNFKEWITEKDEELIKVLEKEINRQAKIILEQENEIAKLNNKINSNRVRLAVSNYVKGGVQEVQLNPDFD